MAQESDAQWAEREQIARLAPEDLKKLRAHAVAQIEEIDAALKRAKAGHALSPLRDSAPQRSRQSTRAAVRKRRFIRAYLVGPTAGNGMESARAAGYRGGNPSLMVIGSRLLRLPDVQEAMERTLEASGATVERLAAETGAIAFAGAREIDAALAALEAGTVADLPDHIAAAIKTLRKTQGPYGPNLEVSAHDKLAAIALYARLRNLMPAGGAGVNVTVTIEDQLREIPEDDRRRAIDRYVRLTMHPSPDVATPWTPALTSGTDGHESSNDA